MKRSGEFERNHHALAGPSSSSSLSPRKRQHLQQVTLHETSAGSCGGDGQAPAFELPPLTGISQTIEDRSSVFQAFFVPLVDSVELAKFMPSFRRSAHCKNVDHAMYAYYFPASQGVVRGAAMQDDVDEREGRDEDRSECGYEDDGERFAGAKLQALLLAMKVHGVVICVREYGGIMLGPIRFQHIVQCARDAVMRYRLERSRVEAESEKTRRLLRARDLTIDALRKALQQQRDNDGDTEVQVASQQSIATDTTHSGAAAAARDGDVDEEEEETAITSSSQQRKDPMDKYRGQSHETLKRLLLARDKTIQSLRAVLAAQKSGSSQQHQ